MRMMLYQTGRIVNTTIRHDLGMPKESFLGPFRSLKERRVPVMYGYSQHVLPRPSDWDDLTQVAGYWFLDPATDWVPPVDVVDFLRAGAPPVYIGFGSMSNRNPEETTQLVLKAFGQGGEKGGWGGGPPPPPPPPPPAHRSTRPAGAPRTGRPPRAPPARRRRRPPR